MQMSGHTHAMVTLLPVKFTQYTINRRLIGPTSGLHGFEEGKMLCLSQDSNHSPFVVPT